MKLVHHDPWQALKQFTAARVALGRAGDSLPTNAVLDFGIAHAQARDAVHATFQVDDVSSTLRGDGLNWVTVHSLASDRATFLRRPDLGRRLDNASRERLHAQRASDAPDVVFVVADGLSALAAQRHGPALLRAIVPCLNEQQNAWQIGPVVIAEQARVALGDEIGELLGARQVAMLIGERPGLTAPHSLGVYLTWSPRIGRTDAERNCISNIRPEGLGYAIAAQRLAWLLNAARQRQLTGVALKDDSGSVALPDVSAVQARISRDPSAV